MEEERRRSSRVKLLLYPYVLKERLGHIRMSVTVTDINNIKLKVK
jgi:hypothetical protein